MEILKKTLQWQVKAITEEGVFSGYGSVFGVCDFAREIVASGAFSKSLARWKGKKSLPALLWMHDPAQPIGVWTAMHEDAHGLKVQGKLALRTKAGREAYELLKMGAISGLSIGYRVVGSRIEPQKKARVLTEVDLFEVSLVTFPANDAARVRAVKKDEGEDAVAARLYQAASFLRS